MTKGDETLRPREKLRLSKEFARVYEEGTVFRTKRLALTVLEENGLPRKVGFVAGRKVGGAVERARAKRFLRESYRRLKKYVKAQGIHLVFNAKVPGSELTYEIVKADMEKLLREAGLISG